MPKRLALCSVLVLLLLGTLNAQEEKKTKKVLKNADIVLMTQNHFDDETLTRIIEVSDTDFDVSTDALVDLMKQGVSSNVCRAMLAATRKKRLASSAPNPQGTRASESATVPAAGAVRLATPPASASPAPRQSPAAQPAEQFAPGQPAASQPAAAPAPIASPETSSSRAPDPAFAVRPSSAPENAAASSGSTPASGATQSANSAPIVASPRPMMNPAAMYPGGGMGISPQQMAMVQSQLAAMGMGGLMGGMGMGMGGMGSFAMNYPPEQMPRVFRKLGPNKGKEEITASMAQIGQSKFNGGMGPGGMALRSLATEGLSFAAMGAGPGGMMAMSAFSMVSGFMPGMRPGAPKITYVWGLPGRTSSRTLSETDPIFELNYGDIPGVDPDAYEPAVLKLVQTKDNYRLVGATQLKMTAKNMRNGANPENGKWLSEDRWPSHCDKEERGFYVLRVDTPLEPGEYAVVLRPVKGYKAPSSGLGGHAQVFYSVWDFSVPGAHPDDGKRKRK